MRRLKMMMNLIIWRIQKTANKGGEIVKISSVPRVIRKLVEVGLCS
jgi:hypothetical protein